MSSRARQAGVPRLEVAERIASSRVGRVVAFERGEPRVEWDGLAGAPRAARVSAALDDAALAAAALSRQPALLVFEDGDPERPIVLALLRSASPMLDALLGGAPARTSARVDGRRVVLRGEEEIVLECGEASLTLRRDGTVVLKGVNVVSQAKRVQKIRGGKVQIN